MSTRKQLEQYLRSINTRFHISRQSAMTNIIVYNYPQEKLPKLFRRLKQLDPLISLFTAEEYRGDLPNITEVEL